MSALDKLTYAFYGAVAMYVYWCITDWRKR